MKSLIVVCAYIIACSSQAAVGESGFSEYKTTISFAKESRIYLEAGRNDGWYVAPNIGYNIIVNTATEGVLIDFTEGLSLVCGFGVELKSGLAFQFDFGYIKNDVDRITVEATDVTSEPDIEFTQIPFMFNLIWTPSNQPDIFPYFGIGIGTIRGKYEPNAFVGSDAQWAIAGQLRLGFHMEFAGSSTVSFGYQFTLAKYDEDDIDNHTLVLGFQFKY